MRLPLALVAATLLAPTAFAAEATHQVFLHEYSGGLHIVPEQINANVGDTLVFEITNQGAAPHNLRVCGDAPSPSNECKDVWGFIPTLAANATGKITFTAKKAGTFEYYCFIPGHKGGGMVGELRVLGDDTDKKSVPALPVAGALVVLAALALARRWRA